MNPCIRFPQVALCFVVAIAAMGSQAFAVELVFNGDFETEAEEFIVWPGYIGGSNDAGDMNPAEIPEWFGTGGLGINPVFAPSNPADIVGWSAPVSEGLIRSRTAMHRSATMVTTIPWPHSCRAAPRYDRTSLVSRLAPTIRLPLITTPATVAATCRSARFL